VRRVRVGGRQHADFPSEEISSRSDFALLSLRERNRARSVLTGASSPPPSLTLLNSIWIFYSSCFGDAVCAHIILLRLPRFFVFAFWLKSSFPCAISFNKRALLLGNEEGEAVIEASVFFPRKINLERILK